MGKLNEGFCRGFNEIVLVKSNKNPNSIKKQNDNLFYGVSSRYSNRRVVNGWQIIQGSQSYCQQGACKFN